MINKLRRNIFSILLFLILPVLLTGQELIMESGSNYHRMESLTIQDGEINPSLSVRLSHVWQLKTRKQFADLLKSRKFDGLLRKQRLKFFPSLSGITYLNGGNVNQKGLYLDIYPSVTVAANYKLPPTGRFSVLFWSRIEKHSVVSQETISDLTYDFHGQKELGYQKNQGGDSTWVEYDIGDGGILFSYPKGYITLAKSNPIWGPGYSGQLIFSDKIPSFVFFKVTHQISKKWIFSFFHGSLNSTFRDSSAVELYQIKGGLPLVKKFIAAHRLDFFPTKSVRIGLGESVVYGARGIEGVYLIPFMLYWSAQHDLSDSDNLQMFADIDWVIKEKARFYGSLFMDEWDLANTFNKKKNHNWIAYQIGATLKLPFKPNFDPLFRLEYVHLSPYVYVHKSKINTFQNHGHYLGYWAGPNSDNLFVAIEGTPKPGWWIQVYGQRTRRGEINDETIKMQYNNEQIPFLFRTYDGDPETRLLIGIRGEIKLTTYFKIGFDFYQDNWDQWLDISTDDRKTISKQNGKIEILLGI